MKYMTFSRLFGEIYATDAEAKAARDSKYRELKKAGAVVYRSVLRGQMKPHSSYGVVNGGICDCYNLTVDED